MEAPPDGLEGITALRKHRAKRFNEGLKLAATLFNSASILTIGTAFIGPVVQRRYDVLGDDGWAFLLAAAFLHLIAQVLIRFLRPEE